MSDVVVVVLLLWTGRTAAVVALAFGRTLAAQMRPSSLSIASRYSALNNCHFNRFDFF
jgi:hypothetical protein